MRSLSVEDMRRIVSGGELFLLVDVRPVEVTRGKSIPHAVRLPYGQGIAERMLAEAGQLTLPIVVCGDHENCEIAERSAAQLEQAGFREVWTYCSDPAAWIRQSLPSPPDPLQIVSDPDVN